VSLNGTSSKFTPPGDIDRMKPKSMWIICPLLSISMFPINKIK